MTRQLFIFAMYASIIWIVASANAAVGQVLTPPERTDSTRLVKVHFEGVVTAKKKYSFSVKTSDRTFVVKLAPQAAVALKMNKPLFDFPKWTVRVLTVGGATKSETPGIQKKGTARVVYDLPESLFVVAQFDHAHQMKRLMQADVKRLNQYTLTNIDPGPSMPTEESLRISGQLSPGKESTIAQLSINDDSFLVKLGQRGAVLSGFSIQQLIPQSTEVIVWGELGDDDVVSASKIEFWPIKAETDKGQ